MKPIITTYIITLILLAILPINGTNSSLNNNYILSIRWDYILHAVVYIPLLPLLMLRTSKLETSKLQNMNLLTILSIGFLIGMSLEAIQYIITWRTFNINDLMANVLGVGIGVVVWTVIKNNKIIIKYLRLVP